MELSFRGRLSWLLFFVSMLLPARGELVLTNYSPARPLKIMPIGDSITDDCSFNGAWRLYLQPLLETNGFPFTFVGRQASSPVAPSFTKINHEGYCGTVIAPPGVFAVHGYNTTDAYLLKIASDALAITNNRPDVVLLLVGANDIGRGRDPYMVATNDMPLLLDLILSKVPDAHILLAKMTSLQSAVLPGLSYGAFATNVPIYNTALQSMVNERRARGQNVFLADMFSAVDYNIMFLDDHVHPNTRGLSAMAREWLARIQAITVRTNQASGLVIHGGDQWKYCDTGQDLGTNWVQPDYDDSGWSNGVGRFGYGDPALVTTVSFGPEATNKYPTTYFRRHFVVPWNLQVTNLNLRLSRGHGAVAWLNGQQLWRTNMPPGTISYTNLALVALNQFTTQVYYPVNLPLSLPGQTNLLAVEVHQSSADSSLFSFDAELFVSGPTISPPLLSIVPEGDGVTVSWPIPQVSGFALYSTTSPALEGSWSVTTTLPQTNGSRVILTETPDEGARFFRLQRP